MIDQAVKPAKVPCPHCGKLLRDRAAVYSHVKAKHPGRRNRAYRPVKKEREESFADRAVQAEIDRAAGIDNPDIDWLLP